MAHRSKGTQGLPGRRLSLSARGKPHSTHWTRPDVPAKPPAIHSSTIPSLFVPIVPHKSSLSVEKSKSEVCRPQVALISTIVMYGVRSEHEAGCAEAQLSRSL
jgi:hypothetical protein